MCQTSEVTSPQAMKIKSTKRVIATPYGEWIVINTGYKIQRGGNSTKGLESLM